MKYILTENTKNHWGITLHQIQAIKDFGIVRKGDLGGWIQKEENLSQYGNARIYGNAKIHKPNHYMCFQSFGSENRSTTVFRTKEGCAVLCGCFTGDLEDFSNAVNETHGDNQYGLEYKAIIEVIKLRVKTWDKED